MVGFLARMLVRRAAAGQIRAAIERRITPPVVAPVARQLPVDDSMFGAVGEDGLMATRQVTGTLTSGGTYTATINTIEVVYPGGERPPVVIDIADVTGVARDGDQVTLFRRDGRETGLRSTSVKDAADLELLVKDVVQASVAADYQREIARLHAHGFHLVAASGRMAMLVRRNPANRLLALVPVLLGALAAAAFAVYYLTLSAADQADWAGELGAATLLALGLAPLLFFLSYAIVRREETAMVTVDETGRVVIRRT